MVKWSQAWQCLCDLSSWLKLVSASICPRAQRGRCVCTLNHLTSVVSLQILFSYILVHSKSFCPSLPHSWHFLPPCLLRVTGTLAVSPQKKRSSRSRSLLCERVCQQLPCWHVRQTVPLGWTRRCAKRAKPRTLCSAHDQIPLNGEFFNSKVWIGWYFKKNSSWLNLEPEKNSILIIHSGSGPTPSFSWGNRMKFHSLWATSQGHELLCACWPG